MAVSAAAAHTGVQPRRRILVADDNADTAESFGEILRMMGNDVHVVTDGLEALKAADALRPDVAMLDLGMPGLSGYELASALRREPWGRSMMLVAVTGWGQAEDRRRSREAGFDHHFVKPVEPGEIERLLDEAPAAPAQ